LAGGAIRTQCFTNAAVRGMGEDHGGDDDLDPRRQTVPGELNMHSFISEVWSGIPWAPSGQSVRGVSFVRALTNHTPK
jgi:hypothetical protein